MTIKAKRSDETMLSLAQVAAEAGMPPATLRAWFRDLSLFATTARGGRVSVDAVPAARALKRFMALDGATLADARRILDAAGPGALIAAFGGGPDAASNEGPARRLQEEVRKAAAAGLFGEVVSEVDAPSGEGEGHKVASLHQARFQRFLVDVDTKARDDRSAGGV